MAMSMPISKHRGGGYGEESPEHYQVMVVKGNLETMVFIESKSGTVNMLRLTPIPGRPDNYEGYVYVVSDNAPSELAPHAKVRAHFEWNYENLKITYKSLPEPGKPPSEVRLFGEPHGDTSTFRMLLL